MEPKLIITLMHGQQHIKVNTFSKTRVTKKYKRFMDFLLIKLYFKCIYSCNSDLHFDIHTKSRRRIIYHLFTKTELQIMFSFRDTLRRINNRPVISFTQISQVLPFLRLSCMGVHSARPPLWSSGQSFWLQIQRYRARFPALPDFLSSSGSGTGSTQPREVN